MSSADGKVLSQRVFLELFNGQRFELADELYDAECEFHHLPAPFAGRRGPDVVKTLAQAYSSAFPDLRYEVGDVIAEGDRVVIRWVARGTHTGPLHVSAGSVVSPSGRDIHVSGISIVRVQGGKIREVWQQADMLGLLQAVGAF